MAYLIVRIEPKGNDTLREKDCEPVVARLHKRVKIDLEASGWLNRTAEDLCKRHGYELGPKLYHWNDPCAMWPLTAYVYISQNKDGRGRVASQLQRVPVREMED